MHKIIFKCQSITPMFLGGADGEPDLRPPSIKGAMRYWWRAMHGHLTIEKLKEKESHIFGNTEQRSKVILRCKTSERLREKQFTKGAGMGIDYLFYAMDMGANKRHYFDDINFEVILKSKDKGMLREAAYAFWLLANLGGIGSRSRRGGGSFVITGVDVGGDLDFDFVSGARDADAWAKDLKKGIEIIMQSTGIHSIQNKTPFNTLQNVGVHLVNKVHHQADDALDFIGQEFQGFRMEVGGKDASNIRDYIDNGSHISTIEKASFGLPISYRFKKDRKSATVDTASEEYNRSASSLFISLVQIGGKYYPLLVNFNSTLLPAGVDIKVSSREQRKNVYPKPPQNTIKQDFIHSLNTIQIL